MSSKLLIGHIFRFNCSRVQLFGVLRNKTYSCKQHAGPHLGTFRRRIELSGVMFSEATEATTDAENGCSRRMEVWWMGSDIDVSNGLLEVFRSPASALSSALGCPYGVVAFTALRCDPAACAFAEFA